MPSASQAFERAVAETLHIGAMLVALLATALVVWSVMLLFNQCLAWLREGIWQPIPAFAIFLSEQAQQFNLQLTTGARSPLRFVPSLGNFSSLEEVVAAISGNMVGLGRMLRWLLDTSLSLWLFLIAIFMFTMSALVDDRAEELKAEAARAAGPRDE